MQQALNRGSRLGPRRCVDAADQTPQVSARLSPPFGEVGPSLRPLSPRSASERPSPRSPGIVPTVKVLNPQSTRVNLAQAARRLRRARCRRNWPKRGRNGRKFGRWRPGAGFRSADRRRRRRSAQGPARQFVVLYFYPKDDTSGCTAEAIAFNGLRRASPRPAPRSSASRPTASGSHAKFKRKHGLALTLAADESARDARGLRRLARKEHVRPQIHGGRAHDR